MKNTNRIWQQSILLLVQLENKGLKRPALTNQLVKSLEAKVESVVQEESQSLQKGLAKLLQKKDYKKKVETKADGTKELICILVMVKVANKVVPFMTGCGIMKCMDYSQ